MTRTNSSKGKITSKKSASLKPSKTASTKKTSKAPSKNSAAIKTTVKTSATRYVAISDYIKSLRTAPTPTLTASTTPLRISFPDTVPAAVTNIHNGLRSQTEQPVATESSTVSSRFTPRNDVLASNADMSSSTQDDVLAEGSFFALFDGSVYGALKLVWEESADRVWVGNSKRNTSRAMDSRVLAMVEFWEQMGDADVHEFLRRVFLEIKVRRESVLEFEKERKPVVMKNREKRLAAAKVLKSKPKKK